MTKPKPTFKQKALGHTEHYRCWECKGEWLGKIGLQAFGPGSNPPACPYCPSFYCDWLTYDPERFTDENGITR